MRFICKDLSLCSSSSYCTYYLPKYASRVYKLDCERTCHNGGSDGKELQAFVYEREKQFFEREERALRREKDQYEMKLKLQEQEALLKREADEREMLILKFKLEAEGQHKDTKMKAPRPKLAPFHEENDDIHAFLERFERYAKVQEWPEDTLSTTLSPLLTGKALDVYTGLPPELANEYPSLNTALLKRYQMTETGLRPNSESQSPDDLSQNETQRVSRKRPVSQNSTSKRMLVGQGTSIDSVIPHCEDRLRTRRKKPPNILKYETPRVLVRVTRVAEMVLLARDYFLDAITETDMRWKIRQARPKSLNEALGVAVELEAFMSAEKQRQRSARAAQVTTNSAENDKTKKTNDGLRFRGDGCWACGDKNHLRRDCPKRAQITKQQVNSPLSGNDSLPSSRA
ncbi:hypothetical protein QZH41_014780 [Actinostola sp. cb2023]|nr:hypothetical protein QZH41_014780 [Actinostola sp. cb2023]